MGRFRLCRWQSLGNLRNTSNAGLWYVNGRNTLSNTRWNIGSRQSGVKTSATTTARHSGGDTACFVTRPGRTTIRASIFLRARKAFRRFARHPSLTLARRVCSYWGWVTHTDSRRFIARAHLVEVQRSARALVSISERRVS